MSVEGAKIPNKAEYEAFAWHVGTSHDEDGNPLVIVDGKCIGDVDGVLEFLERCKEEADKGALYKAFKAGGKSKKDALAALGHARPSSFSEAIVEVVKEARRTGRL